MLESKAVSKCARVTAAAVESAAQRSILADLDLFSGVDNRILSGIEQACRYRRFAAQDRSSISVHPGTS